MDSVFLSLLNMSFTACIVVIAVLVIRMLLKKAPKIFSYAIWAVVLFRLLCPFSFESAVGLLPTAEVIPQDIVYEAQPEISTGFEIIDNSVNEILPPATPTASVNPIQIWIFIGRIVWGIGIFALLLYSIIQYALLKRKLIGAKHLRENVFLADGINSPFVMGLIKPKIYLPSSLPQNEYDFIIAHEKCHLKRLDHITRVLSFVALALHWFNPLVWVAYIISAKDMEMSCDEAVMKNMDSDIRAEYSTSLLRLATGKKLITATPLAFGEGDTKGRVKNVMKYKKPMIGAVIVLVVLVAAVVFALGTNSMGSFFTQEIMQRAQNLYVGDVEKIELLVEPSSDNLAYRLFDESEFEDIIALVNDSHGRHIANPEPIAGGAMTLYITQKDGTVLSVSNNGNTYLVINATTFDADYDWLSENWNFEANAEIPDDFHFGKLLETTAEEIDTSNELEQFEQIEIGTPQDEIRERFGEPNSFTSGPMGDIYAIDDKMAIIYYEFDEEKGHPVTEVRIGDRQTDVGELPPMVMIDGRILIQTNNEDFEFLYPAKSSFDGEITSSVPQNQKPTQDDQSNFGENYSYAYINDGGVAVYIDNDWVAFEIEEKAPLELFHDLSTDGEIELSFHELPSYSFKTNSEQISITLNGSEEMQVSLMLYDANSQDSPVALFDLSTGDAYAFTNLTSATNYIIRTVLNYNDATLTIRE